MSAFIRAMESRRGPVVDAALAGVTAFAAHVIGDAQELCPVDTGALKASGTWRDAELEGAVIVAAIGFNVSYAIFVHENLTARHTQGQAKFLETAINQNAPKFVAFMEKRLAAAMAGVVSLLTMLSFIEHTWSAS